MDFPSPEVLITDRRKRVTDRCQAGLFELSTRKSNTFSIGRRIFASCSVWVNCLPPPWIVDSVGVESE